MKTQLPIAASFLLALSTINHSVHGQTLYAERFLSIDETAGEIAIEVTRYEGLSSGVTIDYTTEDIDAESGKDYLARRGTLRFDPGQGIQLIRIPVLDDGLVERGELFRVRLLNPSPGVSVDLPDNQLLVAIADNETPASLDEDFNAAISGSFSDLIPMPDGKLIVLQGNSDDSAKAPALVRLNADGTLDDTFRPTYMQGDNVLWASAHGVDKLLVLKTQPAPDCDGCASLVRLNPDGGLDASFSPPQQLRFRSRPSPVVLPDGRIVVATLGTPGGIVRLEPNGSMDPSFQTAPVGDSVDMMLALPDQSLVLKVSQVAPDRAGGAKLSRLKGDGSSDPLFNVPFEFVWINQLTAAFDGKFHVSARIRHGDQETERFVRLNSDGSVDASFSFTDDPFISGNPFVAIGFDAADRIVGHSASSRGIVRLNRDGSWDRAYIAADVSSSLGGFPLAKARLLRDGRLLFGGGRLYVNGRGNGLVRVDPEKVNRTTFCASCPPVLQVGESAGQALVGIRRFGDTTRPAAVRFSTQSLTARGEADFKPVDTILSFQPLETIRNVSISVVPDYDAEPDESLEVRITSEDGRAYGSDSRATVEIWDDDRIGSKEQLYLPLHAPGLSGIIGMQADGKLLVGRFDNTAPDALKISRLNLSGQPDPGWREALIPFEAQSGWKASLEPDGKIYVIGDIRNGSEINRDLIRLNPDGAIDTGFRAIIPKFPAAVTLSRQRISNLAVMSDGTVLVAVIPEDSPNGMVHHIIRLLADGSLDPTFASLKVSAYALKLAPAAAGRIWLTGQLLSVNDTPRRAIVRLNADGSVDESFSLPLVGAEDFYHTVSSHLKLSDGSFLFGGQFQLTNETRPRFLIRLSPEGRFDSNFAPRIQGRYPYVADLAQQPDSKLLLAGSFELAGGVSRTNLVRLYLDGSVDATFDAGPQASFGPERIFLQPDGQVIGQHLSYDPIWRRFNGDKRAALIAQPSEAGRFQAQVTSYSDQTVIIEASESLHLPDWRPISTNVITAKTPVKFTDPDELKFQQRFYRAVGR